MNCYVCATDDRATVATYLPELTHSGFADATIQQLLDMTTGLKHSEDLTFSDDEIDSNAKTYVEQAFAGRVGPFVAVDPRR